MDFTLDDFKKALALRTTAPIRGVDVAEYANNVDVLALTMIGEARGLSLDACVAVAQTAFNRSVVKAISVKDVCLARLQYSCWWAAGGVDNNQWLLTLAADVVQPDHTIAVEYRRLVTECRYLAGGVLTGALRDLTKNSTHYMTAALYYGHNTPKWAVGKTPVANIGGHVFFNNIPW